MTVKITELGVTVPGKVTRKYDQGADRTTLTLNERQVRDFHESLTQALDFFGDAAQGGKMVFGPPGEAK